MVVPRSWIALGAFALSLATPLTVRAAGAFAPASGVRAVEAADGFDHPVFLCAAPGDTRLFIVEQPGRIRWIENGRPSREVFLDITAKVSYGGERGLLGLAFHPGYAGNGHLYVNYTDKRGDTQVERYTVDRDRKHADPASARSVLSVKQPFPNHNGGMIAFGPDGFLYVGMGDGGAGGDPFGNGQNPRALLAKLLRLDVDHGEPYAIPPGNPFGARPTDGRREIWASGLRNPWRFSFDFATRRLIVADVGQNKYEEVNVVDAARVGANYGWNVREGLHGFGFPRRRPSNLVEPVIEYDHGQGCSVTGGYAYRGKAMPRLAGTIFFSDYCSGWLRSFRFDGTRATDLSEWDVGRLGSVSSFGEDADRELYVVTLEGKIWKLAAR